MKTRKQKIPEGFANKSQFVAVLRPDFSFERQSIESKEPTQYYHYHDCYAIYYLYAGERYYFIKDKTYHVTSGTLVLISPYTIHCSADFSEQGYDRLLINFKKPYIEKQLASIEGVDALESFEKDVCVIPLDLKERVYIEALFESMHAEYKSTAAVSGAYLKSSLIQLLLFISKCEHLPESKTYDYANSTHRMISVITGYINNNYADDITLTAISKKFHISPCYLSRTFKKATGLSFTGYLNNVRIKEAQKILYKTDINILDAAQTVGFKSNTHFGRVFKEIAGMSPTAFRKSKN